MDIATDKHFIDWENHVFGYGYGSGERPVMTALKGFFESLEIVPPGCDGDRPRSYDYRRVEQRIGSASTWLPINVLCHADILEYGTSPRFGWLTQKGEALRDYLDGKSVDHIYATLSGRNQDTDYCEPMACSCQKQCENPMFGPNHKDRDWTPRHIHAIKG